MPTHESNNASELGQSTIKGDLGKRFAAAWSLIDDKQRLRMTKLAEQIAGTTPKLHNSTLPPVDPTQTPMIPIANAAVMLGIKPSTLRDWTRKGWIKGAEKLSGCMHYPLDAIELAASEHPRGPKARKASP